MVARSCEATLSALVSILVSGIRVKRASKLEVCIGSDWTFVIRQLPNV
jgi:hypothetical protein